MLGRLLSIASGPNNKSKRKQRKQKRTTHQGYRE